MQYQMEKQYRLPGFDYSDPGNYFITICINDREQKYFGKLKEGGVILSPLGRIVETIWRTIPEHFKGYILGDYCIMPDHFHSILRNTNPLVISKKKTVNADFKSGFINNPMEMKEISLGYIIRWFKAKVKHEAAEHYPLFRWQKRYYERIIRSDREYYFIQEYINNNPSNYEKERKINEEEYFNHVFSKNQVGI